MKIKNFVFSRGRAPYFSGSPAWAQPMNYHESLYLNGSLGSELNSGTCTEFKALNSK